MLRIFEKSILLRSLNYLRVEHGYKKRFDVIGPLVICSLLYCFSIISIYAGSFASQLDIAARFNPLLLVLVPFFVASLAVVSTFPGPKKIDEPFSMANRVYLIRLDSHGQPEEIEVTPRHFLVLIFSYLSIASVSMTILGVILEAVAPMFVFSEFDATYFLSAAITLLYLFWLSHIFCTTVLAVYLLGDYLHRG